MTSNPHHSPYKSTGGLRRILNALRYSLQGLKAAIKYEAAFRQELALAVLMIPAAFFLGRTTVEVFFPGGHGHHGAGGGAAEFRHRSAGRRPFGRIASTAGARQGPRQRGVMLLLIFAGTVWIGVAISRFVMH